MEQQGFSSIHLKNCPKCHGLMEEGFILDGTHGPSNRVSLWVRGLAEKGFFRGVKTWKKTKIPVTTYRCQSCGFLESYARIREEENRK
ncbi:MAG: hypothetical protein KF678_15200 [Phycisphaeraceae bacterium]|nr:hypothetical protein [Phycisphaeraceae bacterium]